VSQTILVVDDDKEIARLLRAYLEKAGFRTLVAYDGQTAMRTISTERPDLVLLDLMLPDRDGWEITRWVRNDATLAHTPIIMLTARVEDGDKIVGLELGADKYITKPFNPQVVVSDVRALLRRTVLGPPPNRQLRVGALLMNVDLHTLTVNGQAVEVTPTEFDLLRVLMERPNHVFTRLELIESALGYTYEGLERTTDSHIKNIRHKIELDPKAPTYIQTIYGVGYRLQE
jgi:two-component system alkaline phosphatase synthesis response regulator PhoP